MPVRKGKNWHEYKGVKYDVDTFYKKLVWEEILYNKPREEFIHKVWGYAEGCFSCPMCGRPDDVEMNIQGTGVFAKCQYCKVTIALPPIEMSDSQDETGTPIAELLLSEVVTKEKALEIGTRIGAELPEDIMRPPKRASKFEQ